MNWGSAAILIMCFIAFAAACCIAICDWIEDRRYQQKRQAYLDKCFRDHS